MDNEKTLQDMINRFDEAFDRIKKATGMRTQVEIAKMLDIRQSSISDAKRRGVIPSDWLIKLLYLRGINPAWIRDGIGPKFLAPSDNPADANYPYETFPPVRAVDAEIVRKVLRCFPARDLQSELCRRGTNRLKNPGQK